MQNPFDKIIIKTIQNGNEHHFKDTGFFYVVWTENGSGQMMLRRKTMKFLPMQYVLVPPEVSFSVQLLDASHAFFVAFSIEYLQIEAKVFATDIFKLYISHSVDAILQTDDVVFGRINKIKDILVEMSADENVAYPVLHFLLNSILLILIQANQLHLTVPDKNIERMHDFFMLVFQNCLREKNVSFYAEKLNISSKRLNQILHLFSSHSASHFIQENVIMEAKRRLLAGKLNINEIAFELGYNDVAYFSRFFKKWTGMSPEKYRKQLINSLNV